MTPSRLPYTGKCHNCDKAVDGVRRFCNENCQSKYYYANNRSKYTKTRRQDLTEKRIDGVILKAYHAGTLLNSYERARIEQQLTQ
jgi:predicted nucleic acid-binding Zn ribbon protein